MEVKVDSPTHNNATQMSYLTLDLVLNSKIYIPSDDDESARMSETSASTNKTSLPRILQGKQDHVQIQK